MSDDLWDPHGHGSRGAPRDPDLRMRVAPTSLHRARFRWPDADHVLVPDDVFHRSPPEEARELPLPSEVRASGRRRWGFHALAGQTVVDQMPERGSAMVAHRDLAGDDA